jgi:hypothetical protein
MVTEAEPITSTRAEINFVRLALACEAQPDGDSAAAADGDGVGGASEWRRLEAYARRLRELLEDIRRGEQQPSKQQLVEYERMLSAVAARADLARRQTEEQAREVRERTAWRGGGSSAHTFADASPLSAEAPALNAAVAPTLKKSLVDRRSQLLGEGGESARARLVRRRGGAVGHVNETLQDDRKRQERMQEELASMTSALKNNVRAIHSTIVEAPSIPFPHSPSFPCRLCPSPQSMNGAVGANADAVVQDNARLSAMDNDMARNVNKISTTNVKVCFRVCKP